MFAIQNIKTLSKGNKKRMNCGKLNFFFLDIILTDTTQIHEKPVKISLVLDRRKKNWISRSAVLRRSVVPKKIECSHTC